jgi:hypothetical protein
MKILNMQNETTRLYGIYTGGYLVLTNVPVAIANAMSSSLIPTMSRSWSKNDKEDVKSKISMAIRFASIVSFPCAIGLAVISLPVMNILFNVRQDAVLAAYIMIIGSSVVVFYSISTVTNAILQGTSHMHLPVINAGISLILHSVILFVLLTVFKLNVVGLVFGNIFFALSMCILNARSIRIKLNYKQEMMKTFLMPFICSGIMGIAAYISYILVSRFSSSRALLILVPMTVAVPVYVILSIVTMTITKNEILQMPKGRVIVRILQRLRLLK